NPSPALLQRYETSIGPSWSMNFRTCLHCSSGYSRPGWVTGMIYAWSGIPPKRFIHLLVLLLISCWILANIFPMPRKSIWSETTDRHHRLWMWLTVCYRSVLGLTGRLYHDGPNP